STRNTRIERLWVEVGTQFARSWRGFFLRLERLHRLDRGNPHHLWLLHYLFLQDINKDCDDFVDYWNHHPISGKGHDQTPLDMRIIGELTHGRYIDDFETIHPETRNQYPNHDEGTSFETYNIDAAIATNQRRHLHNNPIDVPRNEAPFRSDYAMTVFRQALTQINAEDIIPEHFGVSPGEWPEEGYPESEVIKVSRKDIEITLPFPVWWPRAVAWARGLDTMSQIQAVERGELVV
ncbi:hypothetical protein R3P38DRAFT_2557956, partial [Favolaschia claudopus]